MCINMKGINTIDHRAQEKMTVSCPWTQPTPLPSAIMVNTHTHSKTNIHTLKSKH